MGICTARIVPKESTIYDTKGALLSLNLALILQIENKIDQFVVSSTSRLSKIDV